MAITVEVFHASHSTLPDYYLYRKDGKLFSADDALAAFEGGLYEKVGEFVVAEARDDLLDLLEHVWVSTQNNEEPWNASAPCRSTSVGDILKVDEDLYIAASCGFDHLEKTDLWRVKTALKKAGLTIVADEGDGRWQGEAGLCAIGQGDVNHQGKVCIYPNPPATLAYGGEDWQLVFGFIYEKVVRVLIEAGLAPHSHRGWPHLTVVGSDPVSNACPDLTDKELCAFVTSRGFKAEAVHNDAGTKIVGYTLRGPRGNKTFVARDSEGRYSRLVVALWCDSVDYATSKLTARKKVA